MTGLMALTAAVGWLPRSLAQRYLSPMSILGDVPTACEDSSSQQDGDGC